MLLCRPCLLIGGSNVPAGPCPRSRRYRTRLPVRAVSNHELCLGTALESGIGARSPASEASDELAEWEAVTEMRLGGALVAGATIGLPALPLQPLPSMAEISSREGAEARAEREALGRLSASARRWAERMVRIPWS